MKIFWKILQVIFLLAFLFLIISASGLLKTNRTKNIDQSSFGLHYGINQTTDFFDQAYKNASSQEPTDAIAGITVNHHLLAPNLIAKAFALVATDKPITVILLSPNHFYRGNGGVITSQYD